MKKYRIIKGKVVFTGDRSILFIKCNKIYNSNFFNQYLLAWMSIRLQKDITLFYKGIPIAYKLFAKKEFQLILLRIRQKLWLRKLFIKQSLYKNKKPFFTFLNSAINAQQLMSFHNHNLPESI